MHLKSEFIFSVDLSPILVKTAFISSSPLISKLFSLFSLQLLPEHSNPDIITFAGHVNWQSSSHTVSAFSILHLSLSSQIPLPQQLPSLLYSHCLVSSLKLSSVHSFLSSHVAITLTLHFSSFLQSMHSQDSEASHFPSLHIALLLLIVHPAKTTTPNANAIKITHLTLLFMLFW